MNSILEFWLLGIALAVDCFSVSVASGIAARRFLARPMVLMAVMFGVFQGGMTLMGYLGTTLLSESIRDWDHWIAFGLLLYLGGRMIASDLKGEEESEEGCRMLTVNNILTMSVATSIDALAVGISLACSVLNTSIMVPVVIIAFCSLVLSLAGLAVGIVMGKVVKLHAEVIGGVVLIGIGIKILLEHT